MDKQDQPIDHWLMHTWQQSRITDALRRCLL